MYIPRIDSFVLRVCCVLTFLSAALGEHNRHPRRISGELTSTANDVTEDESGTEEVHSIVHRSDSSPPAIAPTTYSPRHEQYQFTNLHPAPFQRPNSAREPEIIHGHPIILHRQSAENNHLGHHTQQNTKLVPEYNYILTAGGKENIYPQHMQYSPPAYRPQEVLYAPNIVDPSKQYKKVKFALNARPDGNIVIKNDDSRTHQFGNYPFYISPTKPGEKIDVHPPRSTSWKQLGPNIEISSAAEHPVHPPKKAFETAVPERKGLKKRKNPAKGVRQGYINQQHALYVANNLQNLRAIKGAGGGVVFDHGNVLKQSDKFDVTDAMFQEEESKKGPEGQARIRQESPKIQADYSPGQYFPQLLPSSEPPFQPKLQPYHMHTYGKGFIRNIEVETSPSGAKQSVPALIIPLTPDQLNNPFFGNEFGIYVNQPEILNPIAKSRHVPAVANPFPYDIVRSDYYQPGAQQLGNYQYHQQAIPSPTYFRTPEEAYNAFLNYQNQYYRVPFNLHRGATPTSADTKPTVHDSGAASPQQLENNSAPYSPPVPKRAFKYQRQANHRSQHPSHRAEADLKKDYLFESEKEEEFLEPSENSSFYSTSAGTSTEIKEERETEKPETTTKK